MEPRSTEQAPTISLGVRVAVFMSVSILAAILLAILILEIEGRSDARNASNEQLRRARNVAVERLSRDGAGLRRLAAAVARDPRIFALLAVRRSERMATLRTSPDHVLREFRAVAVEIFDVTDEWGATAAASERPSAPEPSRGTSPLVRRALSGQEALGFRLEGGRLYQVAVVPVAARGAVPVGTLTLGHPLDESFAEAIRAGTGADVLLLAGEISTARGGRLVARPIVTTLSDAGARSVLETIGPAPRAEAHGRLREGRPVSLAKSPALAVDVPLSGATEGGAARLLLISPLALETALVPLRQTLLWVGAVAAVSSLLVGLVVGGRVTRRLRGLGLAARKAGAGIYDAPLPALAPDEVGILTADFGAMREQQRREIDRLVELDRMKTDFLSVTAQDLMAPVEEIVHAGEQLAAKNAPGLGPEGLRRLRVIQGRADTLSRIVHDLGSARVVLSQEAEPDSNGQAPGGEEEASIEVVRTEAAFHPTGPTGSSEVPPAASGATSSPPVALAPVPPTAALDVAALVESIAVELILVAAERGIEVGMAIEPDLVHPAFAPEPLATSLRHYGLDAIATLPPGSSISFSAMRSPGSIQILAQGGANPFEALLPLDDASAPGLSQAS